jgi:hypothetical protein
MRYFVSVAPFDVLGFQSSLSRFPRIAQKGSENGTAFRRTKFSGCLY